MNEKVSIEDLVKYLSGKLTDEQNESIVRWIGKSEKNQAYFTKLKEAWEKHKLKNIELSPMEIERSWEEVRARTIDITPEKQTTSWPKVLMRIAAVLIIGLSIGYFGYYYLAPFQEPANIEQASSSEIKEVLLQDGTRVWLNKSSKLSYSDDFNSNQRTVNLTGEAYFEVERNPEKPFIIQSKGMSVQVLGTSFNVDNRTADNQQTVTVTSGKVAVYDSENDKNQVHLIKNEVAFFDNSSSQIKKSVNSNPNFLSWKTGVLSFEKNSLHSTLSTLEKHFEVTFEISDSVKDNYHFTSKFDNLSLDEILKVMEISLDLTFERKRQVILVKRKN